MSFTRGLFGAALAAVAFAGCSLPPVTTQEQSVTIPYEMFTGGLIPPGTVSPIGLPGFSDRQAPPSTFPVPGEARNVKLNTVTLNLKLLNTGPVALRLKLFLAAPGTDVYTTQPLGGDQAQIDLAPNGGSATKNFPIEPSLLQNEKLQLGYTFGSPGSSEPVEFTGDDKVVVTHSVTAQVKLF